MEDRAKPISVNSSSSPDKAIADSSETSSDSDVPSNTASLRNQQNVPVDVESDPCSKTKAFDAGNSSVLGEKDDPKSQSGRQESGLDRFRKRTTKRCDSEGVINRLSTSKFPCDEGTSSTNYFPDSLHEFKKHLKDQSDEAIEQDQAGLLRQLDKLKEQLVQSCNVASEKPKEQVPISSSSTGLNKAPPMRFHSSGNHAVAGPSYYHQHSEPQFPYNNNNSNEVPMHHSLMYPSYGDPHRFPMHGRGSHPLQPSHPYFSGQYVGNNNNGHDLFDAYPQQNGHFHHSSCSCYHCYDNKYWRASAPVVPDVPYNAGFFPHESVMGFAPPHNPRTYGSRGLQPHGRWPSNFSEAQIDVLSRVRPPKVVLSGGSRHIRPLSGGAPFITCQNCFELLQLPKKPEAGSKKQQKVRCGACSCLIDLSVVNNKFVLSTNTASTRQGEARVAADYTSDDYDLLGYVFHSLDDEPRDFPTAPGLISDKSQDMQNVHSHSASLSEDELSSDSLTAKPLGQAQDSPLHDNFVDYSSINHDRSGVGSRSSRSEQEKGALSKTTAMRQNSMKEVSLASEMEVSFNDYSHHNSGVSKDHQQRSKKNGFASIVKKSFKDLTKSIQNDEGNKSNVSVNGHTLTERLMRKAEKQAGAIQPGNYW